MIKKIIIGAVSILVISATVKMSMKYKTWRYWEKALEEIPWAKY